MIKPYKIVVFDLDETLGFFTEFGIFWDSLNGFIKEKQLNIVLGQKEFNEILDLYPEFIRPHILSILNYLKHKKLSKMCTSVLIYTNNQGPKEWGEFIKNYFQSKVHFNLFNQLIGAFKVNGKRIELCRTSNDKSVSDLFRCSKIPKNSEICFLDDVFYPAMSDKNVYYIKVNPYVYNISFDVIIKRFISKSKLLQNTNTTIEDFYDYSTNFTSQYAYNYVEKSKQEYEIDKIVTKKTMLHLQTFFNKKWNDSSPPKKYTNSTVKQKRNVHSKTMRHHFLKTPK